MKRATKITLAAVGGIILAGGIGYAVTRPGPTKKSKKNGKGSGGGSPSPGEIPTISVPAILMPVWNDSMQARVEKMAKDEWELDGKPQWSPEGNLKLARKVAAKTYPGAKLTKDDAWPKTLKQSDQWIAEAQKTKPEFIGARAWQKIWFITGGVMGYTPVT